MEPAGREFGSGDALVAELVERVLAEGVDQTAVLAVKSSDRLLVNPLSILGDDEHRSSSRYLREQRSAPSTRRPNRRFVPAVSTSRSARPASSSAAAHPSTAGVNVTVDAESSGLKILAANDGRPRAGRRRASP
jgi:hypothetical protein